MTPKFINTLLDTAGKIAMQYFRTQGLSISTKSDNSPVSIADKQAEQAIRQHITATYPTHGIIGEEFGTTNPTAEYLWIIDPIDGTKAFIAGENTFANMVCLLHNGTPILSGIGFPAMTQNTRQGERYIAHNDTTTLNNTPIQVQPHAVADCTLCYTGEYMFNADELPAVHALQHATARTKTGGDAYNYCRMATGDAHIVIESDLQPYDYLPLMPIIHNAGGTITDWQGNALTLNSAKSTGGQVLATPAHHAEILTLVG